MAEAWAGGTQTFWRDRHNEEEETQECLHSSTTGQLKAKLNFDIREQKFQ